MTEGTQIDMGWRDRSAGGAMICRACHGMVPDKALVCPACAQRKADDGLRASALARYHAGQGPLYLAQASHHHILPLRSGHVLTLCGDARYKVTIELTTHWKNGGNRKGVLTEEMCCARCWKILCAT